MSLKIDLGNSTIEPSFDGITSTTSGGLSSIPIDNSAYYVHTNPNWGSGGSGAGMITNPTWTSTTFNMHTPTEVENLLKDFSDKIYGLSSDKLNAIGTVFRKTITRYKALDKALNITREIGFFDNLMIFQKIIWDEIAPKVGYKNYNVRDGIWDAMVAQLVKNDLTQKEFISLTTPYGVTLISER